jgi:hypothetical protein
MSLDDWNRFKKTLVFERDRALFKQKYSGYDGVDALTESGGSGGGGGRGRRSSSHNGGGGGMRSEPKRLFDSDSESDDNNGNDGGGGGDSDRKKTKEYMQAVELSTRSIAVEDYKILLKEITGQGFRPRIEFTDEQLEQASLRLIQGARYENFNGYIRESTVGNYGKMMSWGANTLYTLNKFVGSPIALSSRSSDITDADKLKEFKRTVDKLVVDSGHQLGRLYEERVAAVGGPEHMQWSPYIGLGATIVSTAVNLDLKNRWGVNVMDDPVTAGSVIIAKPSGPPEEKKMTPDKAKAASSSAPTKEEAAAAEPAPPKPKQSQSVAAAVETSLSGEKTDRSAASSSSSSAFSAASESAAAHKTAAAIAAENRDRDRKDKVSSPLITPPTSSSDASKSSSSSVTVTVPTSKSPTNEQKQTAKETHSSTGTGVNAAAAPKPKSGLASFYEKSMKTL